MKNTLRQILEEPNFVQIVQSLEPRILAKLVEQIGLEDAGDLIALATAEQLERVFDEDLWQNEEPGKEEIFDGKRFGVWMQILLEMGPEKAAEKFVEMDQDFVVRALGENILVLDLDSMTVEAWQKSDILLDKAIEAALNQSFEQYMVLSKNPEAWDPIIQLFLALDSQHSEVLRKILETLCSLSSEYIEDRGGLLNALTVGEKIHSDVAFEREKRREKEGFVAPLEAAAFFKSISESSVEELTNADFDPLAKAHLRAYEEPPLARIEAAAQKPKVKRLLQLMNQESTEAVDLPASDALAIVKELELLRTKSPKVHAERIREMSYLANALVAGVPYKERRYRPAEAAREVVETANVALEHFGTVGILATTDMVKLFKIGWKLTHP